MDLDKPTGEFVGALLAAQAGASVYQTVAVVMALASRGLIDPFEVASHAESFASNNVEPREDVRTHVAEQLRMFAKVIRAMATMPPTAGRA